MLHATLTIPFNKALTDLEEAVTAFNTKLLHADGGLPAEAVRTDIFPSARTAPRQAAAQIFADLEYGKDMGPCEVLSLYGAIGVSAETMAMARAVNAAKDVFAKAKRELDKIYVPNPSAGSKDKQGKKAPAMITLYRYHLNYVLKRPSLHALHAKRHIVLLDQYPYPPKRVGIVTANSDRKVTQVRWEEVRNRLERKRDRADTPEVSEALTRLVNLVPDDEILVEVVEAGTHARANIAWQHSDRSVSRLQRRMAMPMLYLCGPTDDAPVMSEGGLGMKGRAVRLDTQIEPEPFIGLLHVYRYMPEYREEKKVDYWEKPKRKEKNQNTLTSGYDV